MTATLNPITLVFASYGLGSMLGGLLSGLPFFAYFENRNYISDQLTKRLGVLLFGWLIRHSFMGWFNQKLHFKGKFDEASLQTLKKEMTYAEVNHLLAFVLLQLFVFIMPIFGLYWWYMILMTFVNIVFNMYLVLLQQYNKRRIDKILDSKRPS
ncbi:MAG: hypothetical protein AAFP77_02790 [Bacteroidota bacterium]